MKIPIHTPDLHPLCLQQCPRPNQVSMGQALPRSVVWNVPLWYTTGTLYGPPEIGDTEHMAHLN